jgi:hypothetical protein
MLDVFHLKISKKFENCEGKYYVGIFFLEKVIYFIFVADSKQNSNFKEDW